MKTHFTTQHGKAILGDSLKYMETMDDASVDLIVTSPPYALVSKKKYGNEHADAYVGWFKPFGTAFRRILKDDGSLVVNIGGAWTKGSPTRNLAHYEVMIMMVRELGFHLAQEHYWFKPTVIPGPTKWTCVDRVRVNDAVEYCWWFSKTKHPKANNRNVLRRYSDAMRKSIDTFKPDEYETTYAPSGHHRRASIFNDNGGSIPSNVLTMTHGNPSVRYTDYCRANGLTIHPARFPPELPEYFMRFLTNVGDVVFDPFGGSCVTGWAAENLRRQWTCCEMMEEYLDGAIGRFQPDVEALPAPRTEPYQIMSPCSTRWGVDDLPLFAPPSETDDIEKAIENAK